MKKALALVLALVLALSLGVSAFAVTLVNLKESPKATADVIDISEKALGEEDDLSRYLVGPAGGTFYLTLDGAKEFKDITVTGTGIVSAKVVDYDPETMTGADTLYRVEYKGKVYTPDPAIAKDKAALDKAFEDCKFVSGFHFVKDDGSETWDCTLDSETGKKLVAYMEENSLKVSEVTGKMLVELFGATWVDWVSAGYTYAVDSTSYEYNKALAKELNNQYQTSQYKVGNYDEKNVYVIELTVEPNYSASYKTGSVKISATEVTRDPATNKVTKKTAVSKTISIVSDVAIFEYELVKWAGANEEPLEVYAEDGYSDYFNSGAYSNKDGIYDENDLRYAEATVVSTTAFRALREAKDGLEVEAGDMLVKIAEIGAGQKGVNFAYAKANGKAVKSLTAGSNVLAVYNKDYYKVYGDSKLVPECVKFGFLGDQKIASDFEIEVDLGVTAFDLREFFGEPVEEEDIITYYILKDGKKFDSFTVDYMNVDLDEELVLTINGKAGDTLGMYEIVLEVPADTEAPAEENPNTGAESVIGVVAAMAVVSVAAAAAVSLKK